MACIQVGILINFSARTPRILLSIFVCPAARDQEKHTQKEKCVSREPLMVEYYGGAYMLEQKENSNVVIKRKAKLKEEVLCIRLIYVYDKQ